MIKNLTLALADFDEDFVLETVKIRLESGSPGISILMDLQQGMTMVGERYSKKEYYLSDLMLSADLFRRSLEMLGPSLGAETGGSMGRILLGTPKGDIHDLGKNIFGSLAKGLGFEVRDLGVDVPVQTFIDAVKEFKPHILGFSALVTPAFKPMKEVVDTLIGQNLRDSLKVIVGGGVVTATVKEFVGADGFTTDAMDGLDQCRVFVTKVS